MSGIPVGALKISLGGTLLGGEIWQSGWWHFGMTLNSTEIGAVASNVYSILTTTTGTHLMQALKTNWQTQTVFNQVHVYNYQDTSGQATTVGQASGTGITGTGTKPVMPDQVALCVTLRTPLSGAHKRGRMYLPFSGAALDGNGLFVAADVAAVLAGLKADMALVSADAHLAGFPPVVLSRSLGTTTQINGLTADLRPDIQRRRANRQTRGTMQAVTYP